MGVNVDLNIASTLMNPESEFDVRAQGKSYPTAGFTSEEANLLERQMNDFMGAFDSSMTLELIQQRQDAIALTAAFAKQVFDEKLFGGVNAGDNEIAFDVLRPGHIYQDSGGTIQNDWYFEPNSAGWNDWIGDGSTNNYTVGEDQVMIVFGFEDLDASTEVSAINVDSFGRNVDMIPQDLTAMRKRDNETDQQVKPIPNLIAQENDEVHVRLRHDKVAESQPRLLGFTFGLGNYMNSEDY